MSSRRHVLALLAAAPFAASCGGNVPDYAASWRSPGAGEADPRRFALAHAILAPNPHNTQPWLVELRGEDEMLLYCDLDRRLPFTDPLDRQITMGCGAFIYLFWEAALSLGRTCYIELFPAGQPAEGMRLDDRPIARLTLADSVPALTPPEFWPRYFDHIAARRTNRNSYEARAPDRETLQRIAVDSGSPTQFMNAPVRAHLPIADGRVETDATRVAAIRDLVWRAFDREMRTRGAQEETYRWLRFGSEERARHRDGLYIDVPVPGLLRALGMLNEETVVNPESSANKDVAKEWKRKADTAPAFMWLTTPDDAPATRLLAGMAYARMNLAATAAGLAMHPWSQALQEYAEMAELYREAKTLLGAGTDQTVQMLVRVGYAEAVEPAARRELGDFFRA